MGPLAEDGVGETWPSWLSWEVAIAAAVVTMKATFEYSLVVDCKVGAKGQADRQHQDDPAKNREQPHGRSGGEGGSCK